MSKRLMISLWSVVLILVLLTLPQQAHCAATSTFGNSDGITINDNAVAAPYPSIITVSGVTGTVKKVRVKLNGLTLPHPNDIGVFLVGPQGQNIILMEELASEYIINGTPVFDDSGPLMPASRIINGSYRPSDINPAQLIAYPPPAPARSFDSRLSIFNGIEPNGQWQLYVMDSASTTNPLTGHISSWEIEIQTTTLEVTATPDIKIGGSPFDVTVTARNADNSVDTAYTGAVYFTSSDPNATLPSAYTFVPEDNGSHTFSGVTLNSYGNQSITVSDGGIIGHWKLDEGNGTFAADSSGNGNTATLNGPSWSTDVPVTKYGNSGSLLFSGSTNSVSIPKTTALQLATSTTMAWIKADADVSADRYIWSDNSSNAGSSCRLAQSSGNLICEMLYGVFTINTGVALNDSTWHHVAFVIDDTAKTATVYVDGAAAASTVFSSSMVPSTNPIKLGQFSFLNGSPFLGLLDDVRIYKRALTAAEIALLAAGTDAGARTSTALFVATPTTITVQPQSQTIMRGHTATLSVTAIGDNITYQWYQGNSGITSFPIAGATGSSYTTPVLSGPARYWVRVTGSYFDSRADSTTVRINTDTNLAEITPIFINDNAAATPFPSTINVSGFTGGINKVRVTITGINHTYPSDIGILLVGPGGQKVVLMDGAGGGTDLADVTLIFDDTGSALTTGAISNGTYRPTNLRGTDFPSPAPAGPYTATGLSAFNDTDPNGDWRLYVRDASAGASGTISGGWRLELISQQQVTSFAITGTPAAINGGASFNLTVTAKSADNTTDTGYLGTIYFSSTDATAVLPQPYTFVPGDSGSHTFNGVSFGTAGSQTITVTDSGMAGYWKLDEGAGTTLADASGNGNTASNGMQNYWSTSVPATQFLNIASLLFIANNIATIPKTPSLQLSTNTTAVWIKAETDASIYRILFSDETGSAGYSCYLDETTGILICRFNYDVYLTSGVALNDNTWHHVALVIDNSTATATIYVDGTARQSASATLSPSSAPLRLGALAGNSVNYLFKGLMDDVRIYSSALAASEIATLAAGGGPESVIRGNSDTVTVTSSATAITVQPRNVSIESGQTATLSVTAIGGGTLTYQWYRGNSGDTSDPITNATADSFTTEPLQVPTTYWVQVTGPYGAPVNSASAQVILAASKAVFNNSAAITINDNAAATPYPSTITVSGFTGTIELMRVSLNGINHTWPKDMGVLLVGPRGQSVLLMLGAGGGAALASTNIVFDDTGSALTNAAIVSGTYRPTNVTGFNYFSLLSPAPAAPYGNNLAVFNNTDPNGEWQLYVQDIAAGDSGAIVNGWGIEFLTTTHSLKISVDGSGHGTVTYQEKPVVVNTTYETGVITGQQVTLEPLEDQFSIFAGWTGVPGCSAGICQFSMTENTTATATFNLDRANSVLVDQIYYATIDDAYNADNTKSGAVIRLWGINFSEALRFGLDKTVTLSGNYNNKHLLQSSDTITTISGPLSIRAGKVIADRITIK